MIVGTWFVYNPPPAWPRVSRYPLAYCDQCGEKIGKRPGSLTLLWAQKFHFCSRECANLANRKGGCRRIASEKKYEEKYSPGVINAMHVLRVKSKYENTIEERYGSKSMMGTKHFMEVREQTWIEKYGVTHNFQLPEVQKKSRESRLSMEISYTSKSEDEFYEFLCTIFETNDIKRQVRLNIWPIDFYVKSIDAFIQFDGVYWHGLDRPLSTIKKFKTKTDIVIYKKWMTDKLQRDYCIRRGIRLIRITDRQFSKHLDQVKKAIENL